MSLGVPGDSFAVSKGSLRNLVTILVGFEANFKRSSVKSISKK